MFTDRNLVQRMKDMYKPGTRIELDFMGEDPRPIPPGTKGIVRIVDDMGTVHCDFDNGRRLGLIPEEDAFHAISDERDQELAILNRLFDKLKICDIQLSYDQNGTLLASDYNGNHWEGKAFYRFLTEECLSFREDGRLAGGYFIPDHILKPYVELSKQNGVVPGRPEASAINDQRLMGPKNIDRGDDR